jgi:hypothetical protein
MNFPHCHPACRAMTRATPGRKGTVPRNDDAAWLGRVLEHVMISAMPLDPTVALEPGYDCISVGVRLDHERPL